MIHQDLKETLQALNTSTELWNGHLSPIEWQTKREKQRREPLALLICIPATSHYHPSLSTQPNCYVHIFFSILPAVHRLLPSHHGRQAEETITDQERERRCGQSPTRQGNHHQATGYPLNPSLSEPGLDSNRNPGHLFAQNPSLPPPPPSPLALASTPSWCYFVEFLGNHQSTVYLSVKHKLF